MGQRLHAGMARARFQRQKLRFVRNILEVTSKSLPEQTCSFKCLHGLISRSLQRSIYPKCTLISYKQSTSGAFLNDKVLNVWRGVR